MNGEMSCSSTASDHSRWGTNPSNNHHRTVLNAVQDDVEVFAHGFLRKPHELLRIIGSPFAKVYRQHAA